MPLFSCEHWNGPECPECARKPTYATPDTPWDLAIPWHRNEEDGMVYDALDGDDVSRLHERTEAEEAASMSGPSTTTVEEEIRAHTPMAYAVRWTRERRDGPEFGADVRAVAQTLIEIGMCVGRWWPEASVELDREDRDDGMIHISIRVRE